MIAHEHFGMPSTLQILKTKWIDAIALWRRIESPETLYRAIDAERKYVFAWRRNHHLSIYGRPLMAVKHADSAIGWVRR